MDLEKTFVAIVDSGSLSKAAESMGVAHATISTRLSNLEKQLGARLIQRNARGITLTEVGRYYFQQAKLALAINDEAVAQVKKMATGTYGRLRLNVPSGLIEHWLATPIARFLRENPDVNLEITSGDDILAQIHSGYDISFHWGDLPDSSLYAQELFNDEIIIVATDNYLSEHHIEQHPENIQLLQLTREFGGETKHRIVDRQNTEWFYNHPSRVQTDTFEPQIALLIESIGAAALPKSYVTELLQSNTIRDITHYFFASAFPMTCYAVTAEKPSARSRTLRLIEHIRDYYR